MPEKTMSASCTVSNLLLMKKFFSKLSIMELQLEQSTFSKGMKKLDV